MERGGEGKKKRGFLGLCCTVGESGGAREREKRRGERRREGAVGRVQSDVQTAGYTSELMLPQKAIFSSRAPHPLCR